MLKLRIKSWVIHRYLIWRHKWHRKCMYMVLGTLWPPRKETRLRIMYTGVWFISIFKERVWFVYYRSIIGYGYLNRLSYFRFSSDLLLFTVVVTSSVKRDCWAQNFGSICNVVSEFCFGFYLNCCLPILSWLDIKILIMSVTF